MAFLDKINGSEAKSCVQNITELFELMMRLEKTYPGYGVLNGLRSIFMDMVGKSEEITEKPETEYSYSTNYEHPEKTVCYCPICKRINNILQSKASSGGVRIKKPQMDHIMDQFQNDIVSFRVITNKSLKELLTITSKPWGKKNELQVTITKKPLLDSGVQFVPKFLPVLQDLLSQIPSTKAKSARKRYLPSSGDEPPHKLQKTQ